VACIRNFLSWENLCWNLVRYRMYCLERTDIVLNFLGLEYLKYGRVNDAG
jgi:hypothetical protein